MKNSISVSNQEVFLNVRKAFRLLHEYQCMVISSVRYISSQIDIAEWGGYAQFAGDAVSGSRLLRNASWDWLPMMGWCFHFTKLVENSQWLSISFLIISDTGFIEGSEVEIDNGNLEAFAPVSQSTTALAIFIYQIHPSNFQRILIGNSKASMKNFVKTGKGFPDALFAKCYDLSHLDREVAANQVVDDIMTFSAEKSLPLERTKNA